MSFLPNIVFAILLCIGGGFFIYNIRKLIRNIRLGRPEVVTDHKRKRLKNMLRIAFGQQKMLVRPIVAVLHFKLSKRKPNFSCCSSGLIFSAANTFSWQRDRKSVV